VVLKPLKTTPELAAIGDTLTETGEGLPPGKELEFQWATVDGTYRTELNNNSLEFYERQFTPRRVSLGRFTTDAQGRVTASFKVPPDVGEVHDIYAVLDGRDIAKGGVRIPRKLTMTPTQGPVGTVITFKGEALGYKPFESTLAVRYDNKYLGFMSATTTRGSIESQIRASGEPGKHYVEIGHGSHALFYLNGDQSPVAFLPQFKFEFTVTKDAGPPPDSVDWPAGNLARADAVKTTIGLAAPVAPGARVGVSPASGPIKSPATLEASGLPAAADVEVFWITVSGNRVKGGWDLGGKPLGKGTVAADGKLTTQLTVPDDLGGWHAIRVVQGEKVLAEAPYYVERSLVTVAPRQVKEGEMFTVQLKGVGWTELDNTVAVTYDNAYMGYACGFNTGGDVSLHLTATGGPGTHLIDIYPTIYDGGHALYPWQYNIPQMTALSDHPGLALGYRLPIFHVAITVVE
jgi:hypothetical protein